MQVEPHLHSRRARDAATAAMARSMTSSVRFICASLYVLYLFSY